MNISVEISAASGNARKVQIMFNGKPIDYDAIQALLGVSYNYHLKAMLFEYDAASFTKGDGARVDVQYQTASPYTFETAQDMLDAIFGRLDEVNQAFYKKYPAIYDTASDDYRFVPRRNGGRR